MAEVERLAQTLLNASSVMEIVENQDKILREAAEAEAAKKQKEDVARKTKFSNPIVGTENLGTDTFAKHKEYRDQAIRDAVSDKAGEDKERGGAARFTGSLLPVSQAIGIVSYPVVLSQFRDDRDTVKKLRTRGIVMETVFRRYRQISNCRMLGAAVGVFPREAKMARQAALEALEALKEQRGFRVQVRGFYLSRAAARTNGKHTYYILLPNEVAGHLSINQWDFGSNR